MSESNARKQSVNRRLLGILVIATIGMFGFGFLMVPFYSVICRQLGINGKPDNRAYSQAATVDKSRDVTVIFTTTMNERLPWDFYPLQKKIEVHPGENTLVEFYAKNNSGHTMTVQAVPSISPGEAAKYLKKTECFCFTRQTFNTNEARHMPVLFHLDVDIPKHINTLVLSYTMFDTAEIKHPINISTGRIS